MTESDVTPGRVRGKQLVTLVLMALLGGAIGILSAKYFGARLPGANFDGAHKLLVILAVFLAIPLVLTIHEAGHLLGGKIAGFRALLFIVGPVKIERVGERFRVGWNRNLALAGGVAASAPEDTHKLRRRTLLMVAGGPAASLLGGALAILTWKMALSGAAGGSAVTAPLSAAALIGGLMSLAIGVVTLIPGRTGGFDTDGARILRLVRGGLEAERQVAVLALTGLSMGGRRPREWPGELVERALSPADGTLWEGIAHQFAYSYTIDRGDIGAARRHLDRALALREAMPAPARPALYLQAAYFAALYDGDPVRARDYLGQAKGGLMIAPHQPLLAEAAVRVADGDAAGAVALLQRAGEVVGGAVDQGGACVEREWIESLLIRAQNESAENIPKVAGVNP